jgi:acyl carrier protein
MDSLDLLSLVTAVEDEFGIAIPDPVAMRLRCASDVIELVSG